MPTNFKNKIILSADIIYEIYHVSITKCSVKIFADIYIIYSIKVNNIVSIYYSQHSTVQRLVSLVQQSTEFF